MEYVTETNSQCNWLDPPKVLGWHHERHRKSCCVTVIMVSAKEHNRRTLCMLWCNWSYPSHYLSAGMDHSRKGAQGQAEPCSQNLQKEKPCGNFFVLSSLLCVCFISALHVYLSSKEGLRKCPTSFWKVISTRSVRRRSKYGYCHVQESLKSIMSTYPRKPRRISKIGKHEMYNLLRIFTPLTKRGSIRVFCLEP